MTEPFRRSRRPGHPTAWWSVRDGSRLRERNATGRAGTALGLKRPSPDPRKHDLGS